MACQHQRLQHPYTDAGHSTHEYDVSSPCPVVDEGGSGEPASAMARWIAPGVARTTRVCVYDQAGHGRSEGAPGGRADDVRDLHGLLRRAGIPGPYVIAGHSLGGLFALDYTRRYPTQVAGVVLLDSMHPRQSNAFAGTDPLLDVVPTLARTGLARLFFDAKDGDPKAQARQLARDIADMPAEMDRAAKLGSLGDRPLGVVTPARGLSPDGGDSKTSSQRSRATPTTGSSPARRMHHSSATKPTPPSPARRFATSSMRCAGRRPIDDDDDFPASAAPHPEALLRFAEVAGPQPSTTRHGLRRRGRADGPRRHDVIPDIRGIEDFRICAAPSPNGGRRGEVAWRLPRHLREHLLFPFVGRR